MESGNIELLKKLVLPKQALARGTAEQVNKLFYEVSGDEVTGCLCSAGVRRELHRKVTKWLNGK